MSKNFNLKKKSITINYHTTINTIITHLLLYYSLTSSYKIFFLYKNPKKSFFCTKIQKNLFFFKNSKKMPIMQSPPFLHQFTHSLLLLLTLHNQGYPTSPKSTEIGIRTGTKTFTKVFKKSPIFLFFFVKGRPKP
jgi:hypothetical protein